MILTKTNKDVVDSIVSRLNNTDLSRASNGDVVRLIIDVISQEFANDQKTGLYDLLDDKMMMVFVSSAKGEFLDRIGYMMNCYRLPNEEDDTFRQRINNQLLNLATANEIAVKMAVLSISDIDDAIMKPFSFGTGSGAIYIVNKDPLMTENLIIAAQAAVDQVVAWGNKIKVLPVYLIEVEYWIRLIFSGNTADIDKEIIRYNAKSFIENYLNTLGPGISIDPIYIQQEVLKIDPGIQEIQQVKFTLDEVDALFVVQTCDFNERFVQSSKANSVTVL